MDYFGALCLLVGLAGCFLPALPGPPLAYVGMLLLHITDRVQFTVTQLIVWAILVIVVQVLDYLLRSSAPSMAGVASGETAVVSWARW